MSGIRVRRAERRTPAESSVGQCRRSNSASYPPGGARRDSPPAAPAGTTDHGYFGAAFDS